MNKYFLLSLVVCINCSQKKPSVSSPETLDCNDKWEFTTSVTEKKINDSVTQEIVNGKVWFEIIAPRENGDGSTKAYLKNYRKDGSLLSEGFVLYAEHPIADYTEIGNWIFYDCKGKRIHKNNR